jgi:hypothetical protein
MAGQGEVAGVVHRIGVIVGHQAAARSRQRVAQRHGEARVAVVENCRLHLAALALEEIGHAVLGDQDGPATLTLPFVEEGADVIVIGGEDLIDSGPPRHSRKVVVAGDRGQLGESRDGAFRNGIAIAVDHQTGIILRDHRGVQRVGHRPCDGQSPDIPGNMAGQLAVRQTERAELSRDASAGMIDKDDKIRTPVAPCCGDGRRFVGGEKIMLHG